MVELVTGFGSLHQKISRKCRYNQQHMYTSHDTDLFRYIRRASKRESVGEVALDRSDLNVSTTPQIHAYNACMRCIAQHTERKKSQLSRPSLEINTYPNPVPVAQELS